MQAQESKPGQSRPGRPIVCYGSGVSHLSHRVPANPGRANPNGRLAGLKLAQQQSGIDVTYIGFPLEVSQAFGRAIDPWTTVLYSSVPIRIRAVWDSLPGNTLASTKATKLYRGFAEALQPDVWYPVALAEKLTGRDLNGPTEPDIEIILNNKANWYFGTDGNTPADRTDLVSVVLQEVAHGVGFTSAGDVKGDNGSLRDDGYLLIYDLLLANKAGGRLSLYPDPSPDLRTQFTSDALYLHSPTASNANPNGWPKVFAPAFYNSGASLSHLDEAAYPPGDSNSLLTPYFANGESVHELGSIVPGVLADLGWSNDTGTATEVRVYPNPGAGVYTIRLPLGIPTLDLGVFDLTGQPVKTVPGITASLFQLDVSTLPSGVYVLRMITPTGSLSQKLILSH